jgi:hypothetical protein
LKNPKKLTAKFNPKKGIGNVDYSLKLIKDGLTGPAVIDELVADLVDDVFDDVDVNGACCIR